MSYNTDINAEDDEYSKVELSVDEVDEIRQVFDLFDTTGNVKIDLKELRSAMQALGFDTKNPVVYQLVSDLDTPAIAMKGGVDFNTAIGLLNAKLGDRSSA